MLNQNFVDQDRAGINLKKETSKNRKKSSIQAENDMIVDDDHLEYTQKKKCLDNAEKTTNELSKKGKGIPIYEIKN